MMDNKSINIHVVSLFDSKIEKFVTGLKFQTENVKSTQMNENRKLKVYG